MAEVNASRGLFAAAKNYLPFLEWMPNYKREYLPGDLIAGLTITTMVIPQSMAYALLAGLPPIMGLYASILPTMVYGLLGSTGVLTLGPTAITEVMTLSTLSALAAQDSPQYFALAFTFALIVGVVFILMGVFRLGFIANLLSQPVLAGYMNAASLIILFSQLQNITGIRIGQSPATIDLLLQPLRRLNEINWVTMTIGISGIALLIFFRGPLYHWLYHRKVNPTLAFVITRSGPLIVALLATSLVAAFRLDVNAGVRVIGDIPSGLPQPVLGPFDFSRMDVLLPGAIALAFVGFMEGISTAKSLISQRQRRVDANQELFAIGVANIATVVSGGVPVTTSISRSAVNHAAGANTGLSSIIGALSVAVVVTFLTPVFYYLPQAALASIIMISVVNLIQPQMVLQFRRYSKGEPIPFIITFFGSFFGSIALGVSSGIIASALIHLWRTSRPPIIRLERLWDSTEYADPTRFDTQPVPSVLVMRIDESLYFANMQYVERFLRNALADRSQVKYLILDFSAVNTVDASAIEQTIEFIQDFQENGIEVYITNVKTSVQTRLERVNFPAKVGEERFFLTTHQAVIATGQLPDEMALPI